MKIKIGLLFSLIICYVIAADGKEENYTIKYKNPSANGTVTKETFDELAKLTYRIIGYIEEVNTEKIISLWPESKVLNEVLIDPDNDRYVTKQELVNDFNNKGQIYAMYFDTEKHYRMNKKLYDLSYNKKTKMDMKLCVRDILIKYKSKNIRIKNINVTHSDLIEIYLTWDDKEKSESSKISYRISFSKKNNAWVLSSFLGRMPY